jgi:choline dehydrogenase-like flavoprotein
MRVDPRKGVVDANLQVHVITDLVVGRCAVYPTYGGAPPTLSLPALALRPARSLKICLR